MQDVSYLTRHYFFAIELPSKGQDSSLGSSQREAHMNNGSTQSGRDFILRRNRKRRGDRIKDVTSGFRTASLHGASRETSNRTATCYNRNGCKMLSCITGYIIDSQLQPNGCVIYGTQAYLDMELSDVMSFGERIALKLRFGWDTVEENEHRHKYYNHAPEAAMWDCVVHSYCIIHFIYLYSLLHAVIQLNVKL